MVRVDLEESLSYGPRWVIGEGDESGGLIGLGILSSSEVVFETSGAVLFRLGNAVELGPVLGLQVGLFHDNQVGTLQLQPTLGLVVRPPIIGE